MFFWDQRARTAWLAALMVLCLSATPAFARLLSDDLHGVTEHREGWYEASATENARPARTARTVRLKQRPAPDAVAETMPVTVPIIKSVPAVTLSDDSPAGGREASPSPSLPFAASSVTPPEKTRPDPPEQGQGAPVDLEADDLHYDDETGTVTASGNVEIKQSGRTLKADQVRYNLRTGQVAAQGNVILMEPNGDTHYADEVELSNEMRNGFVHSLRSYLMGGGQFTAAEGERVNERLIVMRDATYTPCDCDTPEGKAPAWRIRADRVTWDEEENRVFYRNARFEMFGVPVLYTPYLAHPDGQVKRKSGFLTPSLGYDSGLGGIIVQNYYWGIAPHRDVTVGTMLTTREAPVGLFEYRHRFSDASLHAESSLTYSEKVSREDGSRIGSDEKLRGHIFAEGRWDMNERWRSGLSLALASDKQYLRQYDFSREDILENELYIERFSGRDYAAGRLLAFQDVRVRERRTDQPNVLPETDIYFTGAPNGLLGGRWDGSFSTLGLRRDSGQDMVRASASVGWEGRHVTGFGLINTLDLRGRGDAYWVHDRDVAAVNPALSKSGQDVRFFPQAHLITRYPLVRNMDAAQIMVEPIGAVTLATNVDNTDSDIPNEDSQDAQIDPANIFSPNRFPGKDRVEDRARATYGFRTGIYSHGGSHGSVFVGQSYRFHGDDNPFPRGSGLSSRKSDWVGQIDGSYQGRYNVNYRTQLDSENMSSQRHEVDARADFGRFDISTNYMFVKGLEDTDLDRSREQIRVGAGVHVTRHWRVRGMVLRDLGRDAGLRRASLGFDYEGCCLTFSATANRRVTSRISGESSTDVMFRIGLKGLGSFETSGTTLWSSSAD